MIYKNLIALAIGLLRRFLKKLRKKKAAAQLVNRYADLAGGGVDRFYIGTENSRALTWHSEKGRQIFPSCWIFREGNK